MVSHKSFYNEPLDIIPALADCPVILAADPFPANKVFIDVPRRCKEIFVDQVIKFCSMREIHVLFQPENALSEQFTTQECYMRATGDFIHFNDNFWGLYVPLIDDAFRRVI